MDDKVDAGTAVTSEKVEMDAGIEVAGEREREREERWMLLKAAREGMGLLPDSEGSVRLTSASN